MKEVSHIERPQAVVAAITSESSDAAPASVSNTAAGAQKPLEGKPEGEGNTGAGKPEHELPGPTVTYQWTARIRCKAHEFAESFWVFLFFSPVPAPIPQHPSEWRSSRAYVGSHHFFINSNSGRCANCQNQAYRVIEGFIHLNDALTREGIHSLDAGTVVPFLTANLNWRIQRVSMMTFSER